MTANFTKKVNLPISYKALISSAPIIRFYARFKSYLDLCNISITAIIER